MSFSPALLSPRRALTVWLLFTLWSVSSALLGQQIPQGYRLGPGDSLSIAVVEVPELAFSSPISPNGTISLPADMGFVRVSGLTLQQAQSAIKEKMERFLRAATVNLTIDQTRSSTVRLLGAVNQPGDRTISASTTLFELLTRKDELRNDNAGTVVVRRTSSTGLIDQVEIPLSALFQDLDPRYNLPLMNRDIVTIPAGEEMIIYFAGEVATSISFGASEPKTLLRAVAKAGGLTERSSGKMEIKRTLADGTKQIIEARYKRILDGREPDIKLERGDVIIVKRSII